MRIQSWSASFIVLAAAMLTIPAALTPGASAQDPATGWIVYAVGSIDSKFERITQLSMKWKVGAMAKTSSAFYSPWFGMDPSDNLNLIQPVNPWSGNGWR